MVFLGVDWEKIFSVPFWLDVNPGELSNAFEHFFIFVLVVNYGLFLLSKLIQKQLTNRRNLIKAKFWQKFANFCLTMAVSFSFIFFFRYEAIPYLGGRYWILIWLIVGLIWTGYLVKYYFIEMPNQLKDLANKQQKDKYLVRVKKKK